MLHMLPLQFQPTPSPCCLKHFVLGEVPTRPNSMAVLKLNILMSCRHWTMRFDFQTSSICIGEATFGLLLESGDVFLWITFERKAIGLLNPVGYTEARKETKVISTNNNENFSIISECGLETIYWRIWLGLNINCLFLL